MLRIEQDGDGSIPKVCQIVGKKTKDLCVGMLPRKNYAGKWLCQGYLLQNKQINHRLIQCSMRNIYFFIKEKLGQAPKQKECALWVEN